MGIEIRVIQGEACPVIVCDITGEVIRDAKLANAVWSECEGPKKGKVFFVKKGSEPTEFTRRCEAWYDLPVFLFWLGSNAGVDFADAAKQASAHMCDGELRPEDKV